MKDNTKENVIQYKDNKMNNFCNYYNSGMSFLKDKKNVILEKGNE